MGFLAKNRKWLLLLGCLGLFVVVAWMASSYFQDLVTMDEIATDSEFSGGKCLTEDSGKIAISKDGRYFVCDEKSNKWEPVLR